MCCFDKTGTITAENLVLEGVAGVEYVIVIVVLATVIDDLSSSTSDKRKLVDVKETARETTLCLAAAHALVRLDDGTVVGDPMEKTTLEALDWKLTKGMCSIVMLNSCVILTIRLDLQETHLPRQTRMHRIVPSSASVDGSNSPPHSSACRLSLPSVVVKPWLLSKVPRKRSRVC